MLLSVATTTPRGEVMEAVDEPDDAKYSVQVGERLRAIRKQAFS